MNDLSKYTVVAAFVSELVAYSCYDFLWHRAWHDFLHLSINFYVLSLYLNTKGKWSIAVFIFFLGTLTASLDEWFWDPLIKEPREYIFFLITISITLLTEKKWRR